MASAPLIATGHDVLVTAGFYSVFQWEFDLNTVAALLLLAGYSINDTVVVFDRIRENRRKYKRMSLPDLINLSTNQIATRTTLVSVATALSVVPLLFGGPVLLNFSRAILFGIVVGTFSSTYVAAALLLYLPRGRRQGAIGQDRGRDRLGVSREGAARVPVRRFPAADAGAADRQRPMAMAPTRTISGPTLASATTRRR